MSYTADTLVRELGYQCGDFYLSSPDSTGSATTLSDQYLAGSLPQDINLGGLWVYGCTNTEGNAGIELRSVSWTAATHILTIQSPGFPSPVVSGNYEINFRWARARKLAALNSGIRQLGLAWTRHVVINSNIIAGVDQLQTVANQWLYPLPTVDTNGDPLNWVGINKVQIQIATDPTLVGYPYVDASPWDYAIYKTTDDTGNTVWQLQFANLPMPMRQIRIFGEVQAPELVADTDTLQVDGDWGPRAIDWLYDWALYRLTMWEGMRQPASLADKYKVWSLDRLNAAKDELLQDRPVHSNPRIVVPGRGTGTYDGSPLGDNAGYLGAFQTLH